VRLFLYPFLRESTKEKYLRKGNIKAKESKEKAITPKREKIPPIEVFSGYLGIFEVFRGENLRK
jgi:hypothetical protein